MIRTSRRASTASGSASRTRSFWRQLGAALGPGPLRRAFVEERAHALLRVLGHRVHRHDAFGQVVRAVLVELDLRVERVLADPDRQRARPRLPPRPAPRPLRRALPRATTRFTRPHSSGCGGVDRSPVSSISSARLRPIARDSGTIGVEQNSPILTPGRREPRGVGRHREVRRGDQLAAGRGRDPAHLGDHRLREPVDRLHQVGAGVEQLAGRRGDRDRPSRLRSWPAENAAPAPAQHHRPDAGSRPDRVEYSRSSSCITASDSAFRFSGRLSVIHDRRSHAPRRSGVAGSKKVDAVAIVGSRRANAAPVQAGPRPIPGSRRDRARLPGVDRRPCDRAGQFVGPRLRERRSRRSIGSASPGLGAAVLAAAHPRCRPRRPGSRRPRSRTPRQPGRERLGHELREELVPGQIGGVACGRCGEHRAEQMLHRVVAEERREQGPHRRQVRDARRVGAVAPPGRVRP